MHILVVKLSSLGDIIHAFPVLEYLKQVEPHAKIDWVAEQPFAELVCAHPSINQVITTQTKKWRKYPFNKETWSEIGDFRQQLRSNQYDLLLDLQGNVKSALVTALARSSCKVGFGLSTVPEWPNCFATHKRFNAPKGKNIRDDYVFLAQSAFGQFYIAAEKGIKLKLKESEKDQVDLIINQCKQMTGLKVLVAPGSNWPNKQLSISCFESFLQCFSKKINSHFLFLWGNQLEKNIAEELTLFFPQSTVMNQLTLPALQNFMSYVDLVLAMDSLPLHLAGTTATPTYSIFGPSSANKYKPTGERHKAFQGNCPYGKQFEKRCHLLRTCQTGACIKNLEGEELYRHFEDWWSNLA